MPMFTMLSSVPADMEIGEAAAYSLLGFGVVFFGLICLMVVIMIMAKLMHRETPKAAVSVAPVAAAPEAPKEKAKGSAGEVKLHDVAPADAAMLMAIVADKMGKPLNELRFKSIKEVR